MNCPVARAASSITRDTMPSRLIAMLSACRTRRSRSGLRSSGLPSLSVTNGVGPARIWSIARYMTRRLSASDSRTRASVRIRATSAVGTWSMKSMSPDSSAAVRDGSLATWR